MFCYWIGTIVLHTADNKIVIPNSLFIPGAITLISASQVVNRDDSLIVLAKDSLEIYKSRQHLRKSSASFKFPKQITDKLWQIDVIDPKINHSAHHLNYFHEVFNDLNPTLIHQRFGHISLSLLAKRFTFLRTNKHTHKNPCPACATMEPRKQYVKRYIQQESGVTAALVMDPTIEIESANSVKRIPKPVFANDGLKRFGRYLHSDTKVVSTTSVRGYNYLYIIFDQDTRIAYGLLGANKNDFVFHVQSWITNFFNLYGRYPAWWKFDSGGEYLSTELIQFLKERGIIFKFTTTAAHNQNAYVERKIGVVWTAVLKLLAFSAVPMPFWDYCSMYVMFILNHVPHSALKFKTPLEYAKFKTWFHLIKVFGCAVWFQLGDSRNNTTRRRLGVLLGISDIKMGYDILDIETRQVIQSRDALCDETSLPFKIAQQPCKIYLDFGTWPSEQQVVRSRHAKGFIMDKSMDSEERGEDYNVSVPDYNVSVPQEPYIYPHKQSFHPPESKIDSLEPNPPSGTQQQPIHDVEPKESKYDVQDKITNPISPITKNWEEEFSKTDWVDESFHKGLKPGSFPTELEPKSPSFPDVPIADKKFQPHSDSHTFDPFELTQHDDHDESNSDNNTLNDLPIPDPSEASTAPPAAAVGKTPHIPIHVRLAPKDSTKSMTKKSKYALDLSEPIPVPKKILSGKGRKCWSNKPGEEWSISDIIDRKVVGNKPWYRVKWDKGGHGTTHKWNNSWEPIDNLKKAPWLVKRFHEKTAPKAPKTSSWKRWNEPPRPSLHSMNLRSRKRNANQENQNVKPRKHAKFQENQRVYFGYCPLNATEEEWVNYAKAEKNHGTSTQNSEVVIKDCDEENISGYTPGDETTWQQELVFDHDDHSENPKENPKENTKEKEEPNTGSRNRFESKKPKNDKFRYGIGAKERRNRKRKYCKDPSTATTYYDHCSKIESIEEILHITHGSILEHLDHDTLVPPKSQKEAYGSRFEQEFKDAEVRELKALYKHGTFEHVLCPPNRTPITCRWVYDFKRDGAGKIIMFKARLVVHGFKQVEGIDFTKTFSSTAQIRTFRMVLALAVNLDMKMTQYDISNAFLNADLKEEIYMQFPKGYPSKNSEEVIKLLKSLYGLKQASRYWQETLYGALKKANVVVCKTESGVLHGRTPSGDLVIVLCWVDDLVVISKNEQKRKEIVDILKKQFLVKTLGELSLYVGIILDRKENGDIMVHQESYERRYTKKYLETDTRPCKVPAPTHGRLSAVDCPVTDADKAKITFPYMSATGSLLYSAICTRPDIMFAVVQLARFNANPGAVHVKANQQALRYVLGTIGQGLCFSKDKNFNGKITIKCFVDSDWGGCPDTRRSTVGYIIHVCGCPVSWKSRLMKTVALSSCEAEFMALTESIREVMWMCRFLDELGIPYEVPEVYCDSSSAINWASDPVQHQRNKHVEIRYYYCRDIVTAGKVHVMKVHTTKNHSDPLTKPVGVQLYDKFRPVMRGLKKPLTDGIP